MTGGVSAGGVSAGGASAEGCRRECAGATAPPPKVNPYATWYDTHRDQAAFARPWNAANALSCFRMWSFSQSAT